MRQQRGFLVAATLVAVGLAFLLTVSYEHEPSYKGRRLSTWLIRYNDTTSQITDNFDKLESDSGEALEEIGTNALPYLLKWLSYEPTATRNKLMAAFNILPEPVLPHRITSWVATDRNETLACSTISGFALLGEKAAPAVPALLRMMHAPGSGPYSRAICAIAAMGDWTIPILVSEVRNGPATRRFQVADYLGHERTFGTNVEIRIPPLLDYLADVDSNVVAAAATSLGRLAINAPIVVPALQHAAKNHDPQIRACVFEALGDFGTNARPAASMLLEALSSTNRDEAEAAAYAIRRAALDLPPDVTSQ